MRYDVYKSLIIFFKAFRAFELLMEEEYVIIECIYKKKKHSLHDQFSKEG